MFERRLKVLLVVVMIASAALAMRAGQIQIIQHDLWRNRATSIMKRDEFIETSRGSIVDRNGLALACDAPCTDACVDYPAIPDEPDPAWLDARAALNLKSRLGDQYKQIRHSADWQSMLSAESNRVKDDLDAMWLELGAVGDKSPEEIAQIRHDIVQRVEMRKRYVWWSNYEQAAARIERENSSGWYRQFLADSAPDESSADKFEIPVGEEVSPHVILHNISAQMQARLARQGDRFFSLSLSPSKYREYPFGRAACNVLGYLGAARPAEIAADADLTDAQVQQRWSTEAAELWPEDLVERYGVTVFRELRKYWPSDQVGRTGIESLCEDTLRGTRGKIERLAETGEIVNRIDSSPGKNVPSSIDILLQQDIENEFIKTRVSHDKNGQVIDTRFNQHGAAVVIKVDTGEVLGLVSSPGFDLNDLDSHYSEMAMDELNRPLLDRATELAVVPGSTVKPIVGSGSITDKIMKATDKIQCRGVLVINGKPQTGYGHCWIYLACTAQGLPVNHFSAGDKHIGPDDMLTITDGIRDSCDVVFENIAMKMKMKSLSEWYGRFGLGRRTGIGIEENSGLLYHPSDTAGAAAETQTWAAGIGQGPVQATPIQMANVAATLARGGVWMRPRLVADGASSRLNATDADRVDLHLSAEAIDAVKTGMCQVCTEDGSGHAILPEEADPPMENDPLRGIQIAGKTGSAQTGGFMSLVDHDAGGKPIGRRQIHFGDPGTDGWYRRPISVPPSDPTPEKHLAHAWFIGYAPADHPQVAFCVLVEYGEAGGRVAGAIAHDLLVDCIKHGYLSAVRASSVHP